MGRQVTPEGTEADGCLLGPSRCENWCFLVWRNVGCEDLPEFVRLNYVVKEWRHACAILHHDFPREWQDIVDVLTQFRVHQSHITLPGGRKSKVAEHLDSAFTKRGWVEKSFSTAIEVDAVRLDSPTHSVDCYKNGVALEIEWNNKDPFFDRDLNNFRLLFELRAISVGIIITKSTDLVSTIHKLGHWGKYGASTTWYETKLLPRLEGGSGGGCPILVFAIKSGLIDPTQ